MKWLRRLSLIVLLSLFCSTVAFGGIDFDGSDDSLNSSVAWDLTGSNIITLSFWLNWDNFSDADEVLIETSINYNNSDNTTLINPNSSSASAFEVAFHHAGAGIDYLKTSFPRPSSDVWHHYAIVISVTGGASVKAYVDGVSQTITTTETLGHETTGFGNYTWYFGARAGTAFHMDAALEEFYIFTRELTQTEVNLVALADMRGSGLQNGSLFNYIPIDDGADGTSADGDTISDRSGNGKTATGNDGGNNTGLTWKAGEVLSYP